MKLLNLPRTQRTALHVGSGFDDFCFELGEGESLPSIDLQISKMQMPSEFMKMHAGVHPYFLGCFVVAAEFDADIISLLVDQENDLGPWIINAIKKQFEADKASMRNMPYIAGMPRPRSRVKYIEAAQAAMVRSKAHALLREFEDDT